MLSEQFNDILRDYRVLLFLVVCLLSQFVGWRMWLRRVDSKAGRWLVHGAFILFNLGWAVTVAAMYLGQDLTDAAWTWVGRPSFSWQMLYIFLILPLGVLGAVLGELALWGRRRRRLRSGDAASIPEDAGRRNFLKNAGTAGALTILGLSGYGIVRQGLTPELTRLTIKVDRLPPALAGFTIAQISDIHLGLWASRRELENAVRLAADQKPDLVVFTGDMVDRQADNASLYFDSLSMLRETPHGVWGVLGNHDHYTGQPERVAEILTTGGLTILMDRQVNLPGLPLSLVGLDDRGPSRSWLGPGLEGGQDDDPDLLDFRKLTGPGPRPGDFTIFLNHRPEGFRQAARRGYRLYLAGHTHGGQYQVPGCDQLNLARAFYRYTSGLYHEHDAWLHVSRGVAAVGLPFRLWAWPEINLIRLEA